MYSIENEELISIEIVINENYFQFEMDTNELNEDILFPFQILIIVIFKVIKLK